MRTILHWNPEREDDYIDGEADTVEELPWYVPAGSCWHGREDDSYLMMLPDGSWYDATELATKPVPEV